MYIYYDENKKKADFCFVRAEIPVMNTIIEDIVRALPHLKLVGTDFDRKFGSHLFQLWDVDLKDFMYIKMVWDESYSRS